MIASLSLLQPRIKPEWERLPNLQPMEFGVLRVDQIVELRQLKTPCSMRLITHVGC